MRIILRKISKIPTRFNAYNPKEPNGGATKELGDYDWYLYQYKILRSVKSVKDIIQDDKEKQIELYLPGNGSESRLYSIATSSFISCREFIEFIIKNYMGFAPYAEGMSREKAERLAKKLVNSFLSCDLEEAIYINFFIRYKNNGQSDSEVKGKHTPHETEPYLISGRIGIIDPVHSEFFELIMGGTD